MISSQDAVEGLTMDRFIARENVQRYRDMLFSEIEPKMRSSVQRLLVEEENKLGKDLELLADIERHIAEGARRIEAQQLRLAALPDGHDGTKRAQAFLDGMLESQRVSVAYHQLVAMEIDRNRLPDR